MTARGALDFIEYALRSSPSLGKGSIVWRVKGGY
jgi:hypothetical protein